MAKKVQELSFIPGAIIMSSHSDDRNYPMLKNKETGSAASIYICNNYMCSAPLNSIDEFIIEIKKRKI